MSRIFLIMRAFRTFIAVLLAGAYFLAASHCQFENLPGFKTFACHDENGPCEGPSDCNDACNMLESGHYRAHHVDPVVPPAIPVLLISLESPGVAATESHLVAAPNFDTVFRLSSWQFSLRTALPVRSPSVIS
jgi:hypothetical protein